MNEQNENEPTKTGELRQTIEQEIEWLREQIRTLQRTEGAIKRQIQHFETRLDDLRRDLFNIAMTKGKENERT